MSFSHIQTVRPLFSVAHEYVRKSLNSSNENQYETLCHVIDQFIDQKLPYQYALNLFESSIKDTTPVQRVASILSQVDVPFSSDLRFMEAQKINASSKKMRQWSEIEDQRLLSGIHKYGTDNWAMVASHMGNTRTRAQCQQRWFRGLDPRLSKRSWSKQEEDKLMLLVNEFGQKNWTRVASAMCTRSDAQCRYHYLQLMKQSQEDEMGLRSSQSAPAGVLRMAARRVLNRNNSDASAYEFEANERLPPINDMISELQRNPGARLLPDLMRMVNDE